MRNPYGFVRWNVLLAALLIALLIGVAASGAQLTFSESGQPQITLPDR